MSWRLLNVRIETVNAAFGECKRGEVARILRNVADRISDDVAELPFHIYDANGSVVGVVTTREKRQ